MGIKTSAGGAGAVFYKVNAKEGCFQHRVDGQTVRFEAGRTTLTGTLIGAKFEEDEFEGVKSESVRLVFKDIEEGQPNMHVNFGVSNGGNPSAFGLRLLSKINLTAPGELVSLTPYLITKGTKLGEITYDNDVAGVSVAQNGQKIREDFGPEVGDKLPQAPDILDAKGKPVLNQGRPMKDKSGWEPILDAQLEQLLVQRFPQREAQNNGQAEGGVDPDHIAEGAAPAAGVAPAREAMRARA